MKMVLLTFTANSALIAMCVAIAVIVVIMLFVFVEIVSLRKESDSLRDAYNDLKKDFISLYKKVQKESTLWK